MTSLVRLLALAYWLLGACLCALCADENLHGQEASQIKELKGIVERKGLVLTLHLGNGKKQIYKDIRVGDCDSGGCEGHYLVRYLKEPDVFIVRNQYYDDFNFDLIRRRDGLKQSIGGMPYFSPNGRRFALEDTSDLADLGHVEVWGFDQAIRREYRTEQNGYSHYKIISWDDDNSLKLSLDTYVDHQPKDNLPSRLVNSSAPSSGWQLVGTPEGTP